MIAGSMECRNLRFTTYENMDQMRDNHSIDAVYVAFAQLFHAR